MCVHESIREHQPLEGKRAEFIRDLLRHDTLRAPADAVAAISKKTEASHPR